MRERIGGRALIREFGAQLPELIETARALAPIAKGAAYRAQNGQLRLKLDTHALEALERSLVRSSRRRESATVGAAMLLGGLVWLGLNRATDWPGWAMLLVGAAWVLLPSLR